MTFALRQLLRPLVVRALARRPDEVARRAKHFAIVDARGRELVARLGRAFIDGYNAMLGADRLASVAREGAHVAPHFRPFFFEGAAMGYLPRGYHDPSCDATRAERALLELAPDFRYLLYVGLGVWVGFRHARRIDRLERLSADLDPLYAPLCYDGFGFKAGFFDVAAGASPERRFARCPPALRRFAYQGFGRALFFVHMEDEAAYERTRAVVAEIHRDDLESGRALALAFTGIDRPAELLAHVARAGTGPDRAARLLGLTWALAARSMTDPAYFETCLRSIEGPQQELLARLPALCEQARREARDYAEWQARARAAALEAAAGVV